MRSLGTSFVSAVAGVILAQMTVTMGDVSFPSQNGFRVTMVVAAGASIVAFVLASFLPKFEPAQAKSDVTVSAGG